MGVMLLKVMAKRMTKRPIKIRNETEVEALVSGDNESGPLPSFLSHLQVSAAEVVVVEPTRAVFGGGAPRR
jgi:hypothetical protein